MSVPKIDTAKAYRIFIATGMSGEEAHIEAVAVSQAVENLVTKDDLKTEVAKLATKDELKAEIQNLEKSLKYYFLKTFIVLIYAPLIVAGILRWFGKI